MVRFENRNCEVFDANFQQKSTLERRQKKISVRVVFYFADFLLKDVLLH